MDIKNLAAAIAVARNGSFTQAARELYVAQSTLSRQILALERDLGRKLFVRGPRVASLTSEGEAFIREAENVLAAVDRAHRAVAGPADLVREPGAGSGPSND